MSLTNSLRDIDTNVLAQIVARALGKPTVEIVEWRCQPLSAGGSQVLGGVGIQRVTGVARADASLVLWSLIVKASKSGAEMASDDPAAWNYWKREALAYQSGLLESIPAGIAVPRCYAVQEQPNGEVWLWLEEIQSSTGAWTMARHSLAARHLGQFNGAYLAGHPLPPMQPWMLSGRTRQWAENIEPWANRSLQYADTSLGRRWFGRDGLQRTLALYAQRHTLLEAFERLPVCYCHHDAHRGNLLDRPHRDGRSETVAIDWALTGYGRVGEDIGAMLAVDLEFLAVAASQARELDQAVFAGYIDGLRDAGWQGDVRLARLGCTINALIVTGFYWNLYFLEIVQDPAAAAVLEAMINRPFDQIIAQYAEMVPFLLDLGDEALALINEIKF